MAKEIYLIRHGLAKNNIAQRMKLPLNAKVVSAMRRRMGFGSTLAFIKTLDKMRGRQKAFAETDSQNYLTRIGEKQAYKTGHALGEKGIFPDMIFCSNFSRAAATLTHIMAGLHAVDPDYRSWIMHSDVLGERDIGELYGYPRSYIKCLFPEEYLAMKNDPVNFRPKGGESLHDVRYKRIPQLLRHINKTNYRILLIVGHGNTNACIRSMLTGEPLNSISLGSHNVGVHHFIWLSERRKWERDPKYNGKQIYGNTSRRSKA